ncbi:MAG: 2-oxo acid dehydrogenase subunit E2 [Pseudomonadota bacterium]|nr:2-oxo acid dehydrogenase subunit E2 [Pseudomonadota bacterium]
MAKETMNIPDLGGVDEVTVLEILVAVGDKVEADQAVMSLESEKASMDVPCEKAATVVEILLKPGDRVKEGTACLVLDAEQSKESNKGVKEPKQEAGQNDTAVVKDNRKSEENILIADPNRLTKTENEDLKSQVPASPGVRKLARTLGIDIQAVVGSGQYGRVSFDDIAATVLARMQSIKEGAAAGGKRQTWQDPTKFGPCQEKEFGKIKKATAKAMSQSWSNVVHVTQFEKADITELEAYRCLHKDALKAQSVRLTMLAFIIKAMSQALVKHPHINSSYDPEGQKLWIKEYYHIGFAVDTPNGLVVPVIRNVEQCSVIDIAKMLASISEKARESKLSPKDMVGASMTVSSLGGIGGEYFTPIVNQPQSAILGVSRNRQQAVWDGKSFQPRMMLPLSLSYDHRVIDGAEAMRFLKDMIECLQGLKDQSLDKSS